MLWSTLELGPMPYPPVGRPQVTEEVFRGLAEQGFVRGRTVHPRLAEPLRLLGEHHAAIDAVEDAGYPVRAMAATGRNSAVLAVLAGGELWLTGIGRETLVPSIAGALLSRPGAHRESGVPGYSRGHAWFGVSVAPRQERASPARGFGPAEDGIS